MNVGHRLFLPVALAAALTACQAEPPRSVAPSAAAPVFRLILNQPLEIPPDAATVRLQFGRVVARNGVQEVEPHCIFEVDSVRDRAQRVEPDEFRVTRVRRSTSTVGAGPSSGFRLLKVDVDDGPGHTQMFYRTEFRLQSATQPWVRALTCQSDQAAPGVAIMRHLTLDEIRAALGGLFSLRGPAI